MNIKTIPHLYLGPFSEVPKIEFSPDDLIVNVVIDTWDHQTIPKYKHDFAPIRYGTFIQKEASCALEKYQQTWFQTCRGRLVAELNPEYISWMARHGQMDEDEDEDQGQGQTQISNRPQRQQEAEGGDNATETGLVGPPSWDNVQIPTTVTEQSVLEWYTRWISQARQRERECTCRKGNDCRWSFHVGNDSTS